MKHLFVISFLLLFLACSKEEAPVVSEPVPQVGMPEVQSSTRGVGAAQVDRANDILSDRQRQAEEALNELKR